ncbi:MAG: cation acetate symporter, partial [Phycisphaerae bacterium]|nr:cation acetate symporter [Phycisphaerae bacterium]
MILAEVQPMAVAVFAAFVGFVLWLSFYLGKKAKSAHGYFAAGGKIHWSVNGISFAGDYLSAASFLGICGMIATQGYDGFLYSIGYLAGWIVALFVVAEPMKHLGKYTFTDALDAKFHSKGIQLTAAISTLVVSICYLIPQMVGAGVLVTPLLGLPHWAGVIMVGVIVIYIVATAGMASTTYVQFLKGALLIVFSTVLVIAVCYRGESTEPVGLNDGKSNQFQTLAATEKDGAVTITEPGYKVLGQNAVINKKTGETTVAFVKLSKDDKASWWKKETNDKGSLVLRQAQWKTITGGKTIYNGDEKLGKQDLRPVGRLLKIRGKSGKEAATGPQSPMEFIAAIGAEGTEVETWSYAKIVDGQDKVTVYYPKAKAGSELMVPGQKFKVSGTILEKMDFASLMLALFLGTAALPHILIRYYTVPSPACARKSTIVAIAAIGLFYVLTLFMGFGAMVNGVMNPADGNMSAPLLAKSFGSLLFAVISAIAFATVLGTVSGLIVASSGAVAHDLMDRFHSIKMTDRQKVLAGKVAALVIGIVAIVLGIVFQGMNVSFLVGWAFAVAASANLPAIIMLLFWKRTTSKGIAASITVGIITAVG